jgi:hypothetical protein
MLLLSSHRSSRPAGSLQYQRAPARNPSPGSAREVLHQSSAPVRDARAAARPVACSNRWPGGRPRTAIFWPISAPLISRIARQATLPWRTAYVPAFHPGRGGCRTPESRIVTPHRKAGFSSSGEFQPGNPYTMPSRIPQAPFPPHGARRSRENPRPPGKEPGEYGAGGRGRGISFFQRHFGRSVWLPGIRRHLDPYRETSGVKLHRNRKVVRVHFDCEVAPNLAERSGELRIQGENEILRQIGARWRIMPLISGRGRSGCSRRGY